MVIESPVAPATCDVPVKPSQLVERVQHALAAYDEEPGGAAAQLELATIRVRAATAIACLPPAQRSGAEFETARKLVRLFSASGASDYAVTADAVAKADECRRIGWPGLMAAMLLVPAWQWPNAPRLEDVPAWLWEDYTRYLFATPQGFTGVGHAEQFAAHALRSLEQLARVATANRGSSAVRAALTAYVGTANCIPIYFSTDSLRRHYELRGKILMAAAGGRSLEVPEPLPRFGRKLRVGIVNRHFGPQTETYTTLPTFEQLDPSRFEVCLFVHQATETAVEAHARGRVAEFHVLPGDVEAQVEALRTAALDVVVFGTNVTAVVNEVTLLALHRVAPLQVVNNSSCTTTGLPEIDLYVSGSATEAADAPTHFTERLGLMPGPAHAFNYQVDRAEPTTVWTRGALGLPDEAVVFVTAANYFKVIPEMQEAWARLLAAVPGSCLLIHPFNPNWSSTYPIARFTAELEGALARHGVEASRLVISSNRFPSRADVKALLSVGDVYLDTFPFGGVNSLVDPLELGMPVAVWEGRTFRSRMGGALLRSLGLEELIAESEENYHALAVRLGTDRDLRVNLGERIRATMETMPVFMDTLAASDAFGALLETAYDELASVGREAFRRERTPVQAPSVEESAHLAAAEERLALGMVPEAIDVVREVLAQNPISVAARTVMGRALSADGQNERAVAYLLAALQRGGDDPMLWYHLARALQKNGQMEETLQAVEGCLRAGPQCLDGWLMLVELAEQAGNTSLAEEASGMARQVAPEDPRVLALTR
jgi:protein O-GlcNAc transferase